MELACIKIKSISDHIIQGNVFINKKKIGTFKWVCTPTGSKFITNPIKDISINNKEIFNHYNIHLFKVDLKEISVEKFNKLKSFCLPVTLIEKLLYRIGIL